MEKQDLIYFKHVCINLFYISKTADLLKLAKNQVLEITDKRWFTLVPMSLAKYSKKM